MLEARTKPGGHSIAGFVTDGNSPLLQRVDHGFVAWKISVDGNISIWLRGGEEIIHNIAKCRAIHIGYREHTIAIALPGRVTLIQLTVFLIIRNPCLGNLFAALHIWLI